MSTYDYVMSLEDELGKYVNQWIAIVDNKIIAISKDGTEVYQKARDQYPDKIPFIMKVPENKVMLL